MASQQNKLIILTAPSGAGKTSITRHLLKTFPRELGFSISAATRQPRKDERNGVDYYFMPVEEFKKKIQNNEFVEWEMVYEGKYYGTLKSELQRIWDLNKTPLLDIDVQGAIHVQQQFLKTSLSIFIQPPSIEELRKRLESRATELPDSLRARINKSAYELTFASHFNKLIVNDDLQTACKKAEEIVKEFLQQP
jgi:guanylate kinase